MDKDEGGSTGRANDDDGDDDDKDKRIDIGTYEALVEELGH